MYIVSSEVEETSKFWLCILVRSLLLTNLWVLLSFETSLSVEISLIHPTSRVLKETSSTCTGCLAQFDFDTCDAGMEIISKTGEIKSWGYSVHPYKNIKFYHLRGFTTLRTPP